jgi:hypothetical protein
MRMGSSPCGISRAPSTIAVGEFDRIAEVDDEWRHHVGEVRAQVVDGQTAGGAALWRDR